MKRVMIVGGPGSGKSTLARALGAARFEAGMVGFMKRALHQASEVAAVIDVTERRAERQRSGRRRRHIEPIADQQQNVGRERV